MVSYILLFISSYFLISTRSKNINLKDINYALLTSSALLSYTLLGFISLILVFLNYSKFPVLIISLLIFLISIIINKNYIKKYKSILYFIRFELRDIFIKINSNLINNKILLISLILLALIITSSIGPINHPDATDYHIGYPYQYYLRGGLFIDGGLHQGLLGIGDYSNLAFIQENTIWLIRIIQIILLPLIFLYFLSKNKLNIFLIVFLSCPLFIQWGTIGKPLFLGDSSIALTYLIWKDNKEIFSLKLLLFCIFSAISIKISSVLISLPILIEIFIFNIDRDFILSSKKILCLLKNKLILLSLLILSSILISRFYITGNFFYPLLTNIFNQNDLIINQFANDISLYRRNGLFPLKIFIPTSLSELSNTIGISFFLVFISFIFYKIRNLKNIFFDETINIALIQTLLLIFFCQWRGDYYACPILLLTYSGEKLYIFLKRRFLRLTFNIALSFQIFSTSLILIISIYQSFITYFNFEYGMKITAYGYASSMEINMEQKGNNLHYLGRNSRLFYPKNYIDNDLMRRCILENSSQDYCIKKYDITRIISYPNFIIDKKNFKCTLKKSIIAKRNPFYRKEDLIEICDLISNSK